MFSNQGCRCLRRKRRHIPKYVKPEALRINPFVSESSVLYDDVVSSCQIPVALFSILSFAQLHDSYKSLSKLE